MAIGSGLGASVGIAPEVTYGTYVAPTRFYEFESETFHNAPTFQQGGGIAAGSYTRRGARRALAAQSAEGSLRMDVPNKGFGLLLNQLFGVATGPTLDSGATNARTSTHTIGDVTGKSFSAQVGVPDTTGTVRPYTFLGGKITEVEFTCAVGELLRADIKADFRQASEVQTLAAPSYAAGIGNFAFVGMALRAGTVGTEAAVDGVTGVKLTVSRSLKTDRNYANAAGLKAEPITNDFLGIEGSVTADFVNKTQFADRFAAGTSTSLVWEFTGSDIESGRPHMIRFTMPMTFFEGDTPQVSGPDVVGVEFPFTVLDDGTNPVLKVEYRSSDTAL